MNIIHVSPEITPLAKAGGLADVVTGLSRAQFSLGTPPLLILPYYSHVNWKLSEKNPPIYSSAILEGDRWIPFQVFTSHFEELTLHLIHLEKVDYFYRNCIYGEVDDNDRFLSYCLAVEKYLESFEKPSIVHVHDWTCAALIPFCKANALLQKHRFMLTIHNVLHQGKCSFDNLKKAHRYSLKEDFIHPRDSIHPYLIAGGIRKADSITTVSPTYSQEIFSSKFGYGLEKLLAENRQKIKGVLNGLDYNYWNPKKDSYLPMPLDNLDSKQQISSNFRKQHQLDPSSENLYCIISRLTHQKGPEFLLAAIDYLVERQQQVFVLGTVDHDLEKPFAEAQKKYEGNPNVCFHLDFNEKLAHQAFAAGDFILIPSIFEPCGLTQLIGYRYFCIPIAFTTGGLKDTIIDIRKNPLNGTGFLFENYELEDFFLALEDSIQCSKEQKKRLLHNIEQLDFSWIKSAKKYLEIYKLLF